QMSVDSGHRSAPRARTRTVIAIGVGALILFLVLLLVGVLPRVRNQRELATAAQTVQTAAPDVYVIRPEPASGADVSLAATTQAIQDAIIYARTSGYLSKRYVDIGDNVKAGQLLAEIASPEIDQQLRQGEADLRQSERTLDLQKANLDLARATMGRYEPADAERAVAKQAVGQSVSASRTAQAAVHPGLRAQREGRSAGPDRGPRAARATGHGRGDPHRQRDRSSHADTADAGRHPQPVAPAALGNVRLRHVQDRAGGHALAGASHRGHLRRARHPGRDRGGGKPAAFSGGGARSRLRDLDRRPGWTAGPRDDREAADGVSPGGPACHAGRIQELVRGLTRECQPGGISAGRAPSSPGCGQYVS